MTYREGSGQGRCAVSGIPLLRDYYEWLIMNSSSEDDTLGIYRPYFWHFSLLARQVLSFEG